MSQRSCSSHSSTLARSPLSSRHLSPPQSPLIWTPPPSPPARAGFRLRRSPPPAPANSPTRETSTQTGELPSGEHKDTQAGVSWVTQQEPTQADISCSIPEFEPEDWEAEYDELTLVCDSPCLRLNESFLSDVKIAVAYIFEFVLMKYTEEICRGCHVNHPSQIRHSCLWPQPRGFVSIHFQHLLKRLWTERFPVALLYYLRLNSGLVLEETRALGAAEAFLYELKAVENIEEKLREILDSAIDKTHLGASLQKYLNVWRNTPN